jgi:hypothetical protein
MIQRASLSALKNKLRRIFNAYIRLRDTDENGVGRCISCNKPIVYGDNCQAGHYEPSSIVFANLDFDEVNVNGQCIHCNKFLEGNKTGYAVGLIRKYGAGVLDQLKIKRRLGCHWAAFEYEVLIGQYRAKANALAQRKMFPVGRIA